MIPPGRAAARAHTRVAACRVQSAVRLLSTGELVVTDHLQSMVLALLAGRPVIALDRDARLCAYATAWLPGASVSVVSSLDEARDAVLERMGNAAFTAHTRRHLPAPTAVERRRPKLVSVVIPARDVAGDIGAQLEALARQDYKGPFEVVVSDNLSSDGTGGRARELANQLGLNLRVVQAGGTSGVSHARNVGCVAARGDLIAICDADDVVAPGWLGALVRTAERFDVVGGVIDADIVNPPRVRTWRMLPEPDALHSRYGFLPYAHGCNVAVWREVWAQSGGWDESIRRGCDDIEFGWRLQLAGYTLGVAPDAVVHYRFRDTIPGHFRQSYGYHRNAGVLIGRFRERGLRRTPARTVAAELVQLLRPLPAAVWSDTARGLAVGRLAALSGRTRSSIEYRTWAL